MKIYNHKKEKLDVLVEGNNKAKTTVIFVHGIGTNKHETAGYFDEIASALNFQYRTVRFDFSGYGKSEGKQEEADFNKQSQDLESVIMFVRQNYECDIYILAQSMGIFVTSLLSPDGIAKTIFTSIPNSNTEYIIAILADRFRKRKGSIINTNGISTLPRSTGEMQKLGPTFWSVLKVFNPKESIAKFAQKTRLIVFHPLSDEICGNKYMDEYKTIKNLEFINLPGDHSFQIQADRQNLIKLITEFFLEK